MTARRIVVFGGIFTLLVVVCLGVVATIAVGRAMDRERSSDEARSREVYADPLAAVGYTANLAFDPRDEKALMEGSQEVFVGRVVDLTARADNDPMPFLEGWSPTARFSVEVEEVRKDATPDDDLAPGNTVTVEQLGVPLPDTKATVCLGNQYPDGGYVPAQMLREGRRYVFATEYHARKGWHALRVDPFGWMVLSEDAPPDEAPEAGDGCPSCSTLYDNETTDG